MFLPVDLPSNVLLRLDIHIFSLGGSWGEVHITIQSESITCYSKSNVNMVIFKLGIFEGPPGRRVYLVGESYAKDLLVVS